MMAGQDVPNLGVVRPPLVYLASIVVGALIQFAVPFPFLPRTGRKIPGMSPLMFSFARS
jgi:hypothetical protein